MTTAPSLFSSPAPLRPSTAAAAAPARSLVDLLYDGFYLLTLLRKHSMPADADAFSGAIQGFLDDFERAALKAGFASQDIFDAKYAFCAAVDEAVLGARTPMADLGRAAVENAIDVVGVSFSGAFPARQAIDRLLELRAMLPPQIALWAGGAAVRGKQKRLPGVRVVADLDDTRQALAEWRSAHLPARA